MGGGATAAAIYQTLARITVSGTVGTTVLALGMCSLCVAAIVSASALQGQMSIATTSADFDAEQEGETDWAEDGSTHDTVGPETAGVGVKMRRLGIGVYLAVVGVALLYALTALY